MGRNSHLGLLIFLTLHCSGAEVNPDVLRGRIARWPLDEIKLLAENLERGGEMHAADLARLLDPKISREENVKILSILLEIHIRDDESLAKVKEMALTLWQTERVEELAVQYYLKYASKIAIIDFLKERLPTLRAGALSKAMTWIPTADSEIDHEACLNLAQRALKRLGVLFETERFLGKGQVASSEGLLLMSSLFTSPTPEIIPFFGQEKFFDVTADSFGRALAHPHQLRDLGEIGVLSVLDRVAKQNPALFFRTFQERVTASTLPQQKVLLYYMFKQGWQRLDAGESVAGWISGKDSELVALCEQLRQSKFGNGTFHGPAVAPMREVFRELEVATP